MDLYQYLLELFIEEISLSSNVSDEIKLEEIVVTGEIKKFLRLDIALIQIDQPTSGRKIQFNSGKSSLFPYNFENLYKKMSDNPFIISLSINNQVVGQTVINWSKEILQLIKTGPETYGVMKPTSMKEVFILTKNNKVIGDIKAIIKLSSFGYNVETSYQVISDKNKNKILIKGIRDETIFQCQKLNQIGTSSEILPIPLLTVLSETGKFESKCSMQPMSLFALYKSNLETKFSFSNTALNIISTSYLPDQTQKTFSTQTFDIVSIVERPKERKLTDIRQYIDLSQALPYTIESSDYKINQSISKQYSTLSNYLTNEKIIALLCKSKDCPAAKKFKEFGLGPLACTQNLGAPVKDAIPPVSYGLSQTYGVLDEYGPYGLFLHPKKSDNNQTDSCWGSKHRQNKVEKKCCTHLPLRLTGGGISNDIKSPLYECKEIMQQLDELVSKYKQALGPCGKTTCSFAPNITQKMCQKTCNKNNFEFSLFSENDAKVDLNFDDAMTELQYLPPAVAKNREHYKCSYSIQPDLPPIHWDCPDALPKNLCKNSDCPHLPKDIKNLNSILSKSFCDYTTCLYDLSQPCVVPMCPLVSKKCPYQSKNKSVENFCSNSNCFYVENKSTYNNRNDPVTVKSTNPSDNRASICKSFLEAINILATHNINIQNSCFGNLECLSKKEKSQQISEKTSPCILPQDNTCIATNNSVSADSKNLSNKTSKDFICNNQDCFYSKTSLESENKIDNNSCDAEINLCCLHLLTHYYPYLTRVLEALQNFKLIQEKHNANQNVVPWSSVTCKEETEQSTYDAALCNDKDRLSSVDYVLDTRTDFDNTPCNKNTCKVNGGDLACDFCPCAPIQQNVSENGLKTEDQSTARSSSKTKKTKQKKKRKFVYSIGDKYPGVKIGHRTCVMPGPNVPASMGWLWNIRSPYHQLKPRRGWRPGAVAKKIAARIRAHREAQGIDMIELKRIQENKYYGRYKSETSIKVNPKPTLQIKKREGCYWITMNPLKDPYSLVENENPYVDCTPLQFKIEKNKDKKKVADAEYKSCFCEDNGVEAEIPSLSSSESELDIEFTPPAGIIHPERFKRKKNVVHCDTQCTETDFMIKSPTPIDNIKIKPKLKAKKKRTKIKN